MLKGLLRLMGRAVMQRVLTLRFALFLLPWLVMLVVPSLRLMLSVQTLGSPLRGEFQYPWTPRQQWDAKEEWPFSPQRLLRKYPKNLDVQVLAAAQAPGYEAQMKKFDLLIKNHPNEHWILSERIRRSNSIKMMRLGQQREPQNLFFDWALMRQLTIDGRQAEALSLLHRTAQKKYYDSHAGDIIRSRIRVYELVRPLLTEEKAAIAEVVIDTIFLPKSLPQSVLWSARQAEQRGEHKHSLQIYGDLLHILQKMRQGADYLFPANIWNTWSWRMPIDDVQELQILTWTKAVETASHKKLNLPKSTPFAQRVRWRASQFAAYARRYGRADLADEAMREAEAMLANKVRIQSLERGPWLQSHVISKDLQNHIGERWYIAMATGIYFLLLIGWRLCAFLPLWVPGLRSEPLRLHDIGLTLLQYIICAIAVLTLTLWPHILDSEPLATYVIVVLSSYLPVMILLSALLCAAVTAWRHRTIIFAPRPPEPGFVAAHVPRSLIPLFLTAIGWTLFAATVLCWLAAYILAFQPNNTITIPLLPILQDTPTSTTTTVDVIWFVVAGSFLSVACYCGWLIRWRWLAPHDLKPIAHYAVRWHLRSLGDLATVLGIAYLIISLSSLPLRREANASLQRFLEQGKTGALQAAMLQQEKMKK